MHLLDYFSDPQKQIYLKVETAIVVDVGIYFVKATYNLEGDGPLILSCYERLSALTAAVEQAFYPNTQAIVKQITTDLNQQRQLLQHAKLCVEPGLTYFANCKVGAFAESLSRFKAARLFSPNKCHEMRPSNTDIDALIVFPFLSGNLDGLKRELPAYTAAAEGIDPDYDVLTFWKDHKATLPSWAAAAAKVLLVQPSSAASERVFSLLKQSFGDQQYNSLQDYIEASLMLQHNRRGL